jgi:hypothetical protein
MDILCEHVTVHMDDLLSGRARALRPPLLIQRQSKAQTIASEVHTFYGTWLGRSTERHLSVASVGN